MDIIVANRLTLGPGFVGTAPVIQEATADVRPGGTKVTLRFSRAATLAFTTDTAAGGEIRYRNGAFFFNGIETEHPVNVRTVGNTVELDAPSGVEVNSVSYVPDTYYPGTGAVFQGPWLISDRGVGALTFHNVPVTTTGIAVDASMPPPSAVVRHGQTLPYADNDGGAVTFLDVRGCAVASVPVIDGTLLIPSLPPGIYAARGGRGRWLTVLP